MSSYELSPLESNLCYFPHLHEVSQVDGKRLHLGRQARQRALEPVPIAGFLPSCAAREPAGLLVSRRVSPVRTSCRRRMRAKPTTGIDALPSPEDNDHRTWPGMPEGAAGQSDKKKGPRQNPASRRFTAGSHMQTQ